MFYLTSIARITFIDKRCDITQGGGRGSKIAKKHVIIYLNGPYNTYTNNFHTQNEIESNFSNLSLNCWASSAKYFCIWISFILYRYWICMVMVYVDTYSYLVKWFVYCRLTSNWRRRRYMICGGTKMIHRARAFRVLFE